MNCRQFYNGERASKVFLSEFSFSKSMVSTENLIFFFYPNIEKNENCEEKKPIHINFA